MDENKYDGKIEEACKKLRTPFPWLLVKAQAKQESAFTDKAVSPCGALGLLQIMPATAKDAFPQLNPEDLFDPEINLHVGIHYLISQYTHFPEIPDFDEKCKFALASYNGGRGYINKALKLAREFEQWQEGDVALWQQWQYTKGQLWTPWCTVDGKHPDAKQICDYVGKIWRYYQEYLTQRREGAKA